MPLHRRLQLPSLMNTCRTYHSLLHVVSKDYVSEDRVSEDLVSEEHASDNGVSEHSLSLSSSLSSQESPTPTMADVLKALANANAKIAELECAAKNPPLVGHGVKIGQPTPFDGKVSAHLAFMSQCQLHFTMYPDSFFSAESKVLFVISFLVGNARS